MVVPVYSSGSVWVLSWANYLPMLDIIRHIYIPSVGVLNVIAVLTRRVFLSPLFSSYSLFFYMNLNIFHSYLPFWFPFLGVTYQSLLFCQVIFMLRCLFFFLLMSECSLYILDAILLPVFMYCRYIFCACGYHFFWCLLSIKNVCFWCDQICQFFFLWLPLFCVLLKNPTLLQGHKDATFLKFYSVTTDFFFLNWKHLLSQNVGATW